MEALMWVGAVVTLAGVAGLGWCMMLALRARRAGLSDAALRGELQRLVALNMAALGVAAVGLMCVVAGIILG